MASYWDNFFTGRLLDDASSAAARHAAPPLSAADAVGRAVTLQPPSARALTRMIAVREATSAEIANHALSRPSDPAAVAEWEAAGEQLQSQLGMIDDQLRRAYVGVARMDPVAARSIGADAESIVAALGHRIPTRVGNTLPDMIRAARARIAENASARPIPQGVAREAKELEDAIRGAATVRMATRPQFGSFEISGLEIQQDPVVRRLLDGPRGQSMLSSLAAKLGVRGDNLEYAVSEAVRRQVLQEAIDGATNAGARPTGLAGERQPTHRAVEESVVGDQAPRTMLADTQGTLENFVPVSAETGIRARRQFVIDPATGRPAETGPDGKGNPIPTVADDTLPARGTQLSQAVIAGRYRPPGIVYDNPKGMFAGRVVNGNVEPDLDKPLLEMVKRRTGGDGNRSAESRLFVLDLKDGRYQVVSIDPTTGDPSPASVMDGDGLDRLLAEGYQVSEDSKKVFRNAGMLRSPIEYQDPQSVGRMIYEMARSGDASPEAIRGALSAVRTWRLSGTQGDMEQLLSAAGNGVPAGGQAALQVLEQSLADGALRELSEVPDNRTILSQTLDAQKETNRLMTPEEGGLSRNGDLVSRPPPAWNGIITPEDRAARIRAARVAAGSTPTMDVGLAPQADASVVAGGSGPGFSADVSSPEASGAIDAASPRYRSVFGGSETRGGTVVDDTVLPGATVDAAAQSAPSTPAVGPLDELLYGRGVAVPAGTMDFTVAPNSWAASALGAADEPVAARLARAAQLNNPFVPVSDIVGAADAGAGRSLNFAEQGAADSGVGSQSVQASPVATARRMATDVLRDRLNYLLNRRGPSAGDLISERDQLQSIVASRGGDLQKQLGEVRAQLQEAQDATHSVARGGLAEHYANERVDALLAKQQELQSQLDAAVGQDGAALERVQGRLDAIQNDPAARAEHEDLTREINLVADELRMRGVKTGDIPGQIKAARNIPEEVGTIGAARYPPQPAPEDPAVSYDAELARQATEEVRGANDTLKAQLAASSDQADPRRIPSAVLRELWSAADVHPISQSGAKRVRRPPAFGELDSSPSNANITQDQVDSISKAIADLDESAGSIQSKIGELEDSLDSAGPQDRKAIKSEIRRLGADLAKIEDQKRQVVERFSGDSAYALDEAGENQARLIDNFVQAKPGSDSLSALRELFSTHYSDPATTFEAIRASARARGIPEPSDQQIIYSALSSSRNVRERMNSDYLWDVAGRGANELNELSPRTLSLAPVEEAPVASAAESASGKPGVLRRLIGMLAPQDAPPVSRAAPTAPGSQLDALHSEIPTAREITSVTGSTYTPKLDGGANAEAAGRLRDMESRLEAIDKSIDDSLGPYDQAPDRRAWIEQQKTLRSNNEERIGLMRQYQPELDQFRRSVAQGAESRLASVEKRIPKYRPTVSGWPVDSSYADSVRAAVAESRAAARSVANPSGATATPEFQTDAQKRVAYLREEMRKVEPDSREMGELMKEYEKAIGELPADSPEAQRWNEFQKETPIVESRPAQVAEGRTLSSARPKDQILKELQPLWEERSRIREDIRSRKETGRESAFDQEAHAAELSGKINRLLAEMRRGGNEFSPNDLLGVAPAEAAARAPAAAPLQNLGYDIHLPDAEAARLQSAYAGPQNSGLNSFEVRELGNGKVEVSMFRDTPIDEGSGGAPRSTKVRVGSFVGDQADVGSYRSGHQTLRFDEDGNAIVTKTSIPERAADDEPSPDSTFVRDAEDEAISAAARPGPSRGTPRMSMEDKGSAARAWNDEPPVPESPAPRATEAAEAPSGVEPDPEAPRTDRVDLSEVAGDPAVRADAEPAGRRGDRDATQRQAAPEPTTPPAQRSRLGKLAKGGAAGIGLAYVGGHVLDDAGLMPDPRNIAGAIGPMLVGGMLAAPVGAVGGGEPDAPEDTNPEEIVARVRQARTPYFIAGHILPR